jgi:hypothetical protein
LISGWLRHGAPELLIGAKRRRLGTAQSVGVLFLLGAKRRRLDSARSAGVFTWREAQAFWFGAKRLRSALREALALNVV